MSYGLLAEFDGTALLLAAARRLRTQGYVHMESYTPFAVEGLAPELGCAPTRVPRLALLGGIGGGLLGYGLQYWSAVIDYPLNLGGRPLHSWPAFIPVTFELTVLGAVLAAFFGMVFLNRLPRYHHPLHGVPAFDTASRHRFFLCVRSHDPRFEPERTRSDLAALAPVAVHEVP